MRLGEYVLTASAATLAPATPSSPERFSPFALRWSEQRVDQAQWDTAYVNDLSDDCFLWIEDGGTKDEGGKTVPRSKRHFPYKDKEGKLDLPHLRNAIARIPQSNAPGLTDQEKERLQAKARKFLEEAGQTD